MLVKLILFILIVTGSVLLVFIFKNRPVDKENALQNMQEINLPEPKKQSKTSLEEAIFKRRSVREYKDESLTLSDISQLLWSCQGITAPSQGGRSAPSAGALYPLEVYLVAKKVVGLGTGVYHYIPKDHKLKTILTGDLSSELASSALDQPSVKQAPVNLVFAAVFERTTQKYGERGKQYVYIEAGHAAQNVCLETQSLNLATVTIGAFDEQQVKNVLKLPQNEIPLYVMPIGHPR